MNVISTIKTSITIKVRTVENSLEYSYFIEEISEYKDEIYTIFNANEPLIFLNLTRNKEYKIEVRASNDGGFTFYRISLKTLS